MYRFSTRFPPRAAARLAVMALVLLTTIATPSAALADSISTTAPVAPALATVAGSSEETDSLESAASKASETGRKIAMSLIGLGFAVASIVLAFRRDFKEAAGIFAVGLIAILLATPAGVNVLHDTVNTLFGSS